MSSAKAARIRDNLRNWLAGYQNHTFLFIDHLCNHINLRLLGLVLLTALLSLILAAVLTQGPQPVDGFRPEQIAHLGMPDTRLQMKFYSLLCVLLFSIALFLGLVRPGLHLSGPRRSLRVADYVPSSLRPYAALLFWLVLLLIYDPKLRDFIFALLVAYLIKEVLNGRIGTARLVFAFAITCVGLYLLPLIFLPAIPDRQLWTMDIHWSAVIGDGIQNAADERHKFEALSAYGLLLTEFIALARKLPLFHDLAGTEALLILVDILFLGIILVIIRQRLGGENCRLFWASALLVTLLFAGTMSGALQNLMTPNALPFRFILMALTAMLAFYLGHLLLTSAAFLFGIIAPLFIAYNFETGVYCILAMGYGFFIKGAKEGIASLLGAACLACVGFLVSGLLLILLLFDGPFDETLRQLGLIMQLKVESGTSGFAGLSYYFFAPFFLVMLHSMMLFAENLLSIRDRAPVSPLAFQGLVIVGLIIAIGPYEMNRYHLTKMWIPLILYVLLMLPRLAGAVKDVRLIWSFTLIVLVAPFLFGNPIRYVLKSDPYVALIARVQGDIVPCIDGMSASRALCDYAAGKADELKELATRYPDAQWLSGLSLTMARLTGTEPALRKKAIFFYAHREDLRDNILADLLALNAPVILFDRAEMQNIAGLPEMEEEFQRNLLLDLGYEITGEGTYWYVARRPSP